MCQPDSLCCHLGSRAKLFESVSMDVQTMSSSNEILKAIVVLEFMFTAAHTVQSTSASLDVHAVLPSNKIFKAINVFDFLFAAHTVQSISDSVDVHTVLSPSGNIQSNQYLRIYVCKCTLCAAC